MRIVVAGGGVRVGALSGKAAHATDDASGVLRTVLEVGVAPRATELASCNGGVECADGAELSACGFGGDGGAFLLAEALDPETRFFASCLSGDLLAIVDALVGAGKPGAAIAFVGACGLGGEVPAGSFALACGGVPSAAVSLNGDTRGAVGAGASFGATRGVVVVPLTVEVGGAGRGVRAVGSRARAAARSSVPEADSTRAFSLGGVSAAGSSALSDGAGGVPDASLVGVTVGHGSILVFARSGARGAVPLAGVDGGTARSDSLLVAAGALIGVGFAILFAARHGNS